MTKFLVISTFVFLFIATNGFTKATSDFDKSGTFFESIKNVLVDKMKGVAPKRKGVYIPYTRIDIAVQNGVEITRVVQTYKNNSKKNLGYNFTLPLLYDTTISQFVLWDHGKRLVASIEGRKEAEDAYKEITGDEAPEFDKDPGLVRKTGNVFNLRIFPICPGENKQMELVAHRRMAIDNDYFKINLGLDSFCRTIDDKSNSYVSANNEVSIYITDDLPIEEIVLADDKLFEKVDLGQNRWLIKGKVPTSKLQNYTFKYKVRLEKDYHIQPTFFSEKGKNYVLMRVLSTWQNQAKNTISKIADQIIVPDNFYLAVWKNTPLPKNIKDTNPTKLRNKDYLLELFAFFSLMFYDKSQNIIGSYYNFADSKTLIDRAMFSVKPARMTDSINTFFNSENIVEKWKDGALEHLKHHLNSVSIKNVIIFMEQLPKAKHQQLVSLIKKHTKTNFIFIYNDEIKNPFKSFDNVSLFTQKGWVQIKHNTPQRKLLNFLDEMFVDSRMPMDHKFSSTLLSIVERFPNQLDVLPSYVISGSAKINNFRTYIPGMFSFFSNKQQDNNSKTTCIWLTGEFNKQGSVNISLNYCNPTHIFSFNKLVDAPSFFNIEFDMRLKSDDVANRFVGAYFAKHEVDNLRGQIEDIHGKSMFLFGRQKDKKLTPAQKEQVKKLRNNIIKLSKQFSFLCSETAFIALPEYLQKKYGFTKQEFDTGQLYNLKNMTKGGLPEPEEYILLFIILIIATLFVIYRRRKLKRT